MLLTLFEVCDKLPLHWDEWWLPHVYVAVFCVLCQLGGGFAGKLVGWFVAALWSGGCLILELSDTIFTPAAIVHELGFWTYALHAFGMVLPPCAMLVAARVSRSLISARAKLAI